MDIASRLVELIELYAARVGIAPSTSLAARDGERRRRRADPEGRTITAGGTTGC